MVQLIREGLRAGTWHGLVVNTESPNIEVLLHGEPVSGVTITTEDTQRHRIAVPVAPEVLVDGIQTFVIRETSGGVLGHFTIGAGNGMEDDLRAEIDLLRAELELLKRAFRRHCAETSA
ncbi:hypothetical protein [Falsirhodobacter deserti]|uniref:hypothetical protein n=1 Tax=Falsirhodobacter deserti TaxID=1365611 RepID=UPI000FE38915|nr:hypothetical protein [Falsirhodobacter deserti]